MSTRRLYVCVCGICANVSLFVKCVGVSVYTHVCLCTSVNMCVCVWCVCVVSCVMCVHVSVCHVCMFTYISGRGLITLSVSERGTFFTFSLQVPAGSFFSGAYLPVNPEPHVLLALLGLGSCLPGISGLWTVSEDALAGRNHILVTGRGWRGSSFHSEQHLASPPPTASIFRLQPGACVCTKPSRVRSVGLWISITLAALGALPGACSSFPTSTFQTTPLLRFHLQRRSWSQMSWIILLSPL
jgi:hypothetical protein